MGAVVRVDDAYLPLAALSTYSGISVRKLHDYLRHQAYPLPHYRIGGRILVRKSEYDAWAQQFRASASSSVDSIVSDVMRGL